MPEFKKLIAKLKKHHGEPALPPAKGPFELVMWENCAYLLSDERRAAVFHRLKEQVGMDPESIWKAGKEVLLPLARQGGMRPETRVFRWQEIARITNSQFGGDLDSILEWPYAKAKRALHQFPCVGQPGADKILMLCGKAAGLPLESNGLRVLERVGFGRAQKNYGATYRSVQEALSGQLSSDAASLTRAHLLLREHGKSLCRNNQPFCDQCPLETECAFPGKQV